MKFLVLGLAGRRGCGKDTMAEYLRAKYGFRVLTYTNDILSPLLKEMGREVTRENLISLALDLRAKSGKHILTRMMCDRIGNEGFWAVSGVRYPEEVEYFKKAFGANFMLVVIECPVRMRYERVVGRGTKGEGGMTFARFMEIEEKETERMIDETVKLADFSVGNDGTMKEFYRRIDELAKRLGIVRP